tara:strand:- start:1336 stop:2037 length:702 start_codon:yes stop_codon:yes gene_type:complete
MKSNKDYIYDNQNSLFGHTDIIGFGDKHFKVQKIKRDIANDIIIKNHYSKKYYNATYIHLGVYRDSELLGVLQYGYAMNPASQKSVVADTKIDEYLELNRMWLDDVLPRNSESKAISYSIKYIKKAYPKIKWVQSFADERCKCFGVVYQASNFRYYGEHTTRFYTLDGVIFHKSLMERGPSLSKSARILQDGKDRAASEDLRQFRYIYFIKKAYIDKCKLGQKEYPKQRNEKL